MDTHFHRKFLRISVIILPSGRNDPVGNVFEVRHSTAPQLYKDHIYPIIDP